MKLNVNLLKFFIYVILISVSNNLFAFNSSDSILKESQDFSKKESRNSGNFNRILEDFSYTADEMKFFGTEMKLIEDKNELYISKGRPAFNSVTYEKGDVILSEIEKRQNFGNNTKKYLVAFVGPHISMNVGENESKFSELFVPGDGYCFWSSAFGFNKKDNEFYQYMNNSKIPEIIDGKIHEYTIFDEVKSSVHDGRRKPIEEGQKILEKYKLIDKQFFDNLSLLGKYVLKLLDEQNITKEDENKIIMSIRDLDRFAKITKSVENFLKQLCNEEQFNDADNLLTMFRVIKEIFCYGTGIDVENSYKSIKRILTNSKYPFELYEANGLQKAAKVMKCSNKKHGNVIRLLYNSRQQHFSRVITTSELKSLKKNADKRNIEIIEISVDSCDNKKNSDFSPQYHNIN